MQITMWPRAALLMIPRSPAMTDSAWAVVSTMTIVRSVPAATCSGESTTLAPRSRSRPTLAGSMSWTTSAKPRWTTLSAIGRPMLPSPMNPTGPAMSFSCR